MRRLVRALAFAAGALLVPAAQAADTPVQGGELTFVVPASGFPSMDAHRETTYAVIHPLRPFYSLLIMENPNNPSDPTDFVGDVAESWTQSSDGKTYTFKLRHNVKFHDGSPMTSRDVKASLDKIIFPPPGVPSSRKGMYSMVDSISAPDAYTVVMRLKFASAAFIPALANPYNWIYKADILAKDMDWYTTHVMGTGAFKFKEYVPGSHVVGVRNPDYYVKGEPHLDGFRALFIKDQAPEVAAIRGGRAMINFRAFPPKTAEDIKRGLGDQYAEQQSPWNCVLIATPNSLVKPFDDARVRRALSLALDRWQGSKALSEIAIVKTVGGAVFPGHPLAASKAELQQMAGYWPDIEKSRAEARRLLKEAGVDLSKTYYFNNRAVDQPYKIVGTWLIDQWKQVGLKFEQHVFPTGPFYDMLRKKKDYDVSLDFNCQSVVNPLVDVSKFLSDDKSGNNYGNYKDREIDAIFDKMNRTPDQAEQRKYMRQMEKLALDTHANAFITLWWYRIIPHRSYVKGWKVSPSHYLNQALDNVWLDK